MGTFLARGLYLPPAHERLPVGNLFGIINGVFCKCLQYSEQIAERESDFS